MAAQQFRRRNTIDGSPTISPLATENRGPRPTALYPNPRNNGARYNEARLYYVRNQYDHMQSKKNFY